MRVRLKLLAYPGTGGIHALVTALVLAGTTPVHAQEQGTTCSSAADG